jgi:hypothetical protein
VVSYFPGGGTWAKRGNEEVKRRKSSKAHGADGRVLLEFMGIEGAIRLCKTGEATFPEWVRKCRMMKNEYRLFDGIANWQNA